MNTRVVARKKLLADRKDEALAIYREMIELTRKEEGCVAYDLAQSNDDPDLVAVIESWESMDALNAHIASEHFGRLIPQLDEFTAEEYPIEIYTEIM